MEPKQKNPQHNHFVISMAGVNIDTTIVTIEEMRYYSEQRKRIAIAVTEKKSYGDIDKMNYQLVGNYTKPKVVTVATKNKPYYDVYNFLLDKFRGGMIVVETDTISDPISDLICKSDKQVTNDIDMVICHTDYQSLTPGEVRRANLMRIHANPEINPSVFQVITDLYQDKAMGIIISQLYANDQYDQLTEYTTKENEKFTSQGLTDFIDIYEYSKQVAFFVYYDILNGKILNVSREDLLEFLTRARAIGMLPVPESDLPVIADSLTVM